MHQFPDVEAGVVQVLLQFGCKQAAVQMPSEDLMSQAPHSRTRPAFHSEVLG